MTQTVGQLGVDLIGHSEGLYLTAYRCPAGIWTIGYGHTAAAGQPQVFPGQTITRDQAVVILRNDLATVEREINERVKVRLQQHQFDALTSFIFNVGAGNFRRSTLLKCLNAGDYAAVPAQLLRWTRANGKVLPGLVKRRHAEAALWGGVTTPIITKHTGPIAQSVDAPPDLPSPIATHATTGLLGGVVVKVFTSIGAVIAAPLHDIPTVHYIGLALILLGTFALGALAEMLHTLLKAHNGSPPQAPHR